MLHVVQILLEAGKYPNSTSKVPHIHLLPCVLSNLQRCGQNVSYLLSIHGVPGQLVDILSDVRQVSVISVDFFESVGNVIWGLPPFRVDQVLVAERKLNAGHEGVVECPESFCREHENVIIIFESP